MWVPVSPHSHQHLLLSFLKYIYSHSSRLELVSYCGFDVYFPISLMTNDVERIFHMHIGHLHAFFGKISIHIFCLFLNWQKKFLIICPFYYYEL